MMRQSSRDLGLADGAVVVPPVEVGAVHLHRVARGVDDREDDEALLVVAGRPAGRGAMSVVGDRPARDRRRCRTRRRRARGGAATATWNPRASAITWALDVPSASHTSWRAATSGSRRRIVSTMAGQPLLPRPEPPPEVPAEDRERVGCGHRPHPRDHPAERADRREPLLDALREQVIRVGDRDAVADHAEVGHAAPALHGDRQRVEPADRGTARP